MPKPSWWEGSLDYGSHPVKELCWLVLELIPSHFLRLDGRMAFSSRTREGDI